MPKPIEVIRTIGRSSKRVAVTVAGFAVVGAGIFFLVFPGPGLLIIIVGFAILGTEYAWARRIVVTAKDRAKRASGFLRRRGRPAPATPPPPAGTAPPGPEASPPNPGER